MDSIIAASLPSPLLVMSTIISDSLPPSTLTLPPPSLITTPPVLNPRNPQAPTPDEQCSSSASQSASQAIREASQSASQAVQQANQSASQSIQQASQQASQSVDQFSNQMSQTLAAASRSVSSALSAMSSADASASSAISRANASVMSAQASATLAQAKASSAILQAGAAVAAATGSAAAAGSSFLAAAATAQASASAIGSASASQISLANQAVAASQNAAVTATQAALAIVGSIIASTLITILVYFLVTRHVRNARRRSRKGRRLESPGSGAQRYFGAGKLPHQRKESTTSTMTSMTGSEGGGIGEEKMRNAAQYSNAKKPAPVTTGDLGVKTTTVKWNPSKPPKAPTLGAWLKLQDGVSPFGPIRLPSDSRFPTSTQADGPSKPVVDVQTRDLGRPKTPPVVITKPPPAVVNASRPLSYMGNKTVIFSGSRSPPIADKSGSRSPDTPLISPDLDVPTPKKSPVANKSNNNAINNYRESQASVWTDEVPSSRGGPSPLLQSPRSKLNPKDLSSTPLSQTTVNKMTIPPSRNPVRNTAEWVAARRNMRDTFGSSVPQGQQLIKESSGPWKPSFAGGLPGNPKMGMRRSQTTSQIRSLEAEVDYVDGKRGFLSDGRGSGLSRLGSQRSGVNTPGVGKAI